MNKVTNKLLINVTKYDLVSGLFISLIIGMISTFSNAGSYLVGMIVAVINFLISVYIVSICLGKYKNRLIVVLGYYLRLGFIGITVLPFTKNITLAIYYTIGIISHYIILAVFGIKNRKGSV